jgi:hypothetical protein
MPPARFRTNALRALPARAIVAAIADAAARWHDADFAPRVRATAAIEARLHTTTPVVDYALDRLFGGMTADAMSAAIVHELGSLDALDGPVAIAGRPAAWARGLDRVSIIASDSTIGVAIAPLAYALSAKCTVTVKDRNDGLTAAFLETLAEERAELGAAVEARSWTGGADPGEARVLGEADAVVAFGGSDALLAIRSRCRADAAFIPFGHRASAGYVAADALAGDLTTLAAGLARDALLYDGAGCLSLHLVFVERGADAGLERFVQALAGACAATAIEFPLGERDPARGAGAARYADAAAFRASRGSGRVLRDPAAAWSIVVDAPHDALPPFGAGAIPLVLVDGPADAAAFISRHAIPLQALGVAGAALDRPALAQALGAVRMTALGAMQDPPIAGHHGGRPRIADFIRWVDFE